VKSSGASAKSFKRPTYSVSCKVGKTVLIMKQNLWKNNLSFANDVPMTCVNSIVFVLTVSEKKVGGTPFVPAFVPPLLLISALSVGKR
jgi:hypothetical protein